MRSAVAIVAIAFAAIGAIDPVARPQSPLETVDAAVMPRTVRTVRATDSAALQQALDAARPGDRIELEPGVTYTGPFRLRRFDGDVQGAPQMVEDFLQPFRRGRHRGRINDRPAVGEIRALCGVRIQCGRQRTSEGHGDQRAQQRWWRHHVKSR